MKRRTRGTGCIVKMRDVYYGRISIHGKVKLVRLSKIQREAQKLWNEWLQENQGLLAFHPKSEVEPANHPLTEAWPILENHFKAKGNTPSVLSNYHRHFNQFLAWTTEKGKTTLEKVTEDDVRLCLAELTEGKSNVLKRNFRYTLKSLWEVLLPTVPNPTRDIRFDWQPQQWHEPLTNEELAGILRVAASNDLGQEYTGLIQTAVYTGLRKKDCVYLNVDDIHDGYIMITPHKTRKKGIQVRIPIHPKLKEVLDSMPVDHEGRFFPSIVRQYEQGILEARLKRMFSKVVETSVSQAGRTRKVPLKSFHSLRATFITRLAEKGVPLTVIESIVGHTNCLQTLRYCHPDNDIRTGAVMSLAF